MKILKIENSKEIILIDNQDFEELSKHKWRLNRGGYPETRSKGKLKRVHNFLIKSDAINVCDHIDGNKLNNIRGNLRIITRTQNNANRQPNKNNKQGTKGVYFNKQNKKNPFEAYICSDNKKIHIGYFATIKEAAEAYNKEAIKKWGEFALLNNIENL